MVSSAAVKGDKVQFGKDHFVQTRVSSSESWKCWIIHVLDLLESYTIWSGSVDLECWPFLISPAVSVEIIFLVATSFLFGWNLIYFSFPTKQQKNNGYKHGSKFTTSIADISNILVSTASTDGSVLISLESPKFCLVQLSYFGYPNFSSSWMCGNYKSSQLLFASAKKKTDSMIKTKTP